MERKEEGEGEGMITRIFVGGLGGSVTSGDLEKTFSSLGVVKAVEIVRTNGRSFAYIDFQPSSHNSLSKLFSTYNGCMWKGGRLKLEKARERYLVRLKKEWAEDAELAQKPKNDLVADVNMSISEKSKLLSPEKMQLRIFFPRLRKVKALPYSGTGKHKYSFQRIEVPSLPIHFCDCEEHCGPLETVKREHCSALDRPTGEINEEEVNMMRSVMNKIFKKEVNSRISCNEDKMATERDKSYESVDDVPFDTTAMDQDSDADNLVINMVTGGSSRLGLVEPQGWRTNSEEQEPKFRKHPLIEDGPNQSKIKEQKRKNTGGFSSSNPTSKKPRLLAEDESKRDEFISTKHTEKGGLESHPEKSKGLKPARSTEPKTSIDQSNIGKTWRQKSSWRELVSQTANSTFSISHILPDSSTKQNLQKSKNLDTQSSIANKQQNLMKQLRSKSAVNSSETLGHGKDEVSQDNVTTPSVTPSKESECLNGNASTNQTTGHSWFQKSSWMELVGETDNKLFSISRIPGTAITRNIPKSSSPVSGNSIDNKQQNLTKLLRSDFNKDSLNDSDVGRDGTLQLKLTAPSAKEGILSGLERVPNNTGEHNSQNEKFGGSTYSKLSENKSEDTGVAGGGKFCTFMRSAASEREWMKTRAALSGALKKKSIEK